MTLRFFASILFVAVSSGYAQLTADTNEWAAISPDSIRFFLKSMGFQFTEKPSDDFTVFALQLNGHPVTVLRRVTSIQLSTCFEDDFAPLKANQWNREHFSTGVFLDERGCASLRAEVKFGGRVTNEMIEEFIREYLTDVTIYAKFLTELPTDPATPSAPRTTDPQIAPRRPSARWSGPN